jgi:hypothetical protein
MKAKRNVKIATRPNRKRRNTRSLAEEHRKLFPILVPAVQLMRPLPSATDEYVIVQTFTTYSAYEDPFGQQ